MVEYKLQDETIKLISNAKKKFEDKRYNLKDELIKDLGLEEVDEIEGWSILSLENSITDETACYETDEVTIEDDTYNLNGEDNVYEYLEEEWEDEELVGDEVRTDLFFSRMKLNALSNAVRDYELAIWNNKQDTISDILKNENFVGYETDDACAYLYNYDKKIKITIGLCCDGLFKPDEWDFEELD